MRMRLLAFFFALMGGLVQAQDIRGMISGTVTDSQGANVVGATVAVTNTDTNVSTPLTHKLQRLLRSALAVARASTR